MALAIFDDLLRRDRADAIDRVELVDGGAAEAERAFFGSGASGADRRPARFAGGDDDLLAVGEACGPVLASTIAPPSGPPARPIASTTRDPAGNRYTPGRRTAPATSTTMSPPPLATVKPPDGGEATASAGPPPPPSARIARTPTSSRAAATAP